MLVQFGSCNMDFRLPEQHNDMNCLDESIRVLTVIAGERPSKGETATTVGTATTTTTSGGPVNLRKYSDRCLVTTDARSHTYRISMANLEETQESELDVILGELSLLEAQISSADAAFLTSAITGVGSDGPSTRTHSRTNSTISATTSVSFSGSSENGSAIHLSSSSSSMSDNSNSISTSNSASTTTSGTSGGRDLRTESPDNDSAFSDTVSLLSSESSASSSASTALHHKQQQQQQQDLQLQYIRHQATGTILNSSKAAKIQLALHKLESASVRRLFVKAFTVDGASKSLLVDERMTCGHVTRLLADKNHVQMQSYWALVENLGDLQMERLFEDNELLVDNLMTWNSDAGNRVLFQQRADKIALFVKPELFLPGPQMAPGSQHDEHTRTMLLDEFFESNAQLQVDGPLYMKADSKKGWKRYHFVLRSSGLYYFPKEKTKNTRDLACLTLFNGYNVYRGLGWKKKWKAPTDFAFGFKSAVDSSLGKTCRTLKMLCAEDLVTMEKWITAIRISKYGKQLWENHKTVMDELSISDGHSPNTFAVSMRSESISSITSSVPSQCGSVSSAVSSMSNSSSGRISRASSSSSSGCLSDDNNGFDSEFTTGTIKRKPSMKPNLPLTTMTRQLKEVGETTVCEDLTKGGGQDTTSPDRGGTLTRRHSRHKSQESNGSGTLKRHQPTTPGGKRGSTDNINTAAPINTAASSIASASPSNCGKALHEFVQRGTGDGVAMVPNGMSSSLLSLDMLPPPPPPVEQEIYGSQTSLASLPPPPLPEEVETYGGCMPAARTPYSLVNDNHSHSPNKILSSVPPVVPAKPVRASVKVVPPYNPPPEYVGQVVSPVGLSTTQSPAQKKVSFADSPVLLRRKICPPVVQRTPSTPAPVQSVYSPGLAIPPRACLSNTAMLNHAPELVPPKCLQESTSNPPRDFLKDLQRVMRKKWQVAQKCKLEPATMPHEVLGFRDFNDDLLAHNLCANASSHYYRETANVSNWVQEHYGAGATSPPPLPLNEYALYENVHLAGDTQYPRNIVGVPPQVPMALAAVDQQRKKRPPPPPPKRSDSTQLTHRV